MKRILLISHFFPPTGGAGVQRSAKFTKYLPENDILPVVVTGRTNAKDRWTPGDVSQLKDIPPEVRVYRAEWNPEERDRRLRQSVRREAYLKAASQAIVEQKPELILVSMSPFQDTAIAAHLSERHGIPWVGDLRDPWALDEFQVYRTRFHRIAELRKMRGALSSATGIVMNTPVATERLLKTFPEFRNRPVVTITNGYDAEDFSESLPGRQRDRFRIVHTGTFHSTLGLNQVSRKWLYRLLGRCAPGMEILPRSPFYLLRALEELSLTDSRLFERVEVVFAGVMSEADKALIAKSSVREKIVATGYLGHEESVKFTASADLLFLPLHKLRDGDESSIVPGKTYEYIASGNPILAALPEGDAKRFVEEAGNSWVAKPDDARGLAQGIRHFLESWDKGAISHRRPEGQAVPFERRTLTRKLAQFLEGLLETRDARSGSSAELAH